MLTVLLYVLVIVVVGAALYFVASVVFGRGEALAPSRPAPPRRSYLRPT